MCSVMTWGRGRGWGKASWLNVHVVINSARAPQGGDKGEERRGRGRGGSEEGRKEEVEGKTREGMRGRGEGEGIIRTVENTLVDKVERVK